MLTLNNETIASFAIVKHSQEFAQLGLYIVKPEFRDQGYGITLWTLAINTMNSKATMALNSVMNQIENYKIFGFNPATLNTRWLGKPKKKILKKIIKANTENSIAITNNFSLDQLINYDAKIFSTPRAAFLSKWIAMPESITFTAIEGDKIRGYGVLCACDHGYKITPLFADNPDIAEKLFAHLCQWVGDKSLIHIDTNETNSFAATLAQKFGLKNTFNTLRMYKGDPPKTNESKIFGLTSLEIG